MTSNQETAALIIDFLKSSLKNGNVPEDNKDSIDFAIESITEAFAVESSQIDTVKAMFGNKSLNELISQSESLESERKPVAESTQSVPVHVDESDEETKEKAEALKLQGNKAMASKDFETAIAKYTEAINLIPTNVVYLSNRAAAYSSSRQHEKALEDANRATEVEPTYAKGWSRLGLAKYALGDAKGALEAYEQGLKVEGATPSDAMKRGYETAKKKVEDNLMSSLDSSKKEAPGSTDSNGPAGGAGGLPDFSQFANMFGGEGGMGGLAGLMNNPQIMEAASKMMQDPNALSNLMSNPRVKQMAESMGLNGGLDDMMNNPMLQNMAKNFMGGNGGSEGNEGADSGPNNNA